MYPPPAFITSLGTGEREKEIMLVTASSPFLLDSKGRQAGTGGRLFLPVIERWIERWEFSQEEEKLPKSPGTACPLIILPAAEAWFVPFCHS